MTQRAPAPSDGDPPSELDVAGNAWMTLWRTVWLDLPLAWAREADRWLYRWEAPTDMHPGLGDPRARDEPHTPADTIPLGLGD